MATALLRTADNLVITLLRDDLPPNYAPPPGHVLVAESALPPGWQFAPPSAEQLAANESTTESEVLRAGLDTLQQIIDSNGTLTGAQLSNAVRFLARGVKRIVKDHYL